MAIDIKDLDLTKLAQEIPSFPEKQQKEILLALRRLNKNKTSTGKVKKAPETDDELWDWVVENTGFKIPRVAVCDDHTAPFQFMADYYFERERGILVLGARESTKCITGSSLIYDPITGLRTEIDEVIDNNYINNIVTMDKNGNIIKKHITKKHSTGEKECLKVTTVSGRQIEVTPEHPFMTQDGWIKADEVEVGDAIATPSFLPFHSDTVEIPDAHVVLMAGLLSEGSISQKEGSVGFSSGDEEFINLMTIASEEINCEVKYRGNYDYAICKTEGKYSPVRVMMKKYEIPYSLSKNKVLPDIIFRLNRKQLCKFISIFWMGDGYILVRQASMGLASKRMLEDFQHLFLKLGIQSRVKYKEAQYDGRIFDAWELSIYGNHIQDFYRLINLWGYKKEDLEILVAKKRCPSAGRPPLTEMMMEKFRKKTSKREWGKAKVRSDEAYKQLGWKPAKGMGLTVLTRGSVKNLQARRLRALCYSHGIDEKEFSILLSEDLWWDFIVDIESVGIKKVYDLTVVPTESFIANDIIVHNTLGVAIMNYAICETREETDACTFADIEAQSNKSYSYIKKFVYTTDSNGKKVIKDSIDGDPLRKETRWKNGSKLEVLIGSLSGVNSPHPQKVHADEIDLMDEEVWKESRSMASSRVLKNGKVVKAQDIATSTRKSSKGLMQKLIDESAKAEKEGFKPPFKLYASCVYESAQEVPECRGAKKENREKRLVELGKDPCELCDCVLPETRIEPVGTMSAVYRRLYEGPVIDLFTASGKKLSVTPNHPILTNCGWVRAGLLKKGDNIVGSLGTNSAHTSNLNKMMTAEDLFTTLEVEASKVSAPSRTISYTKPPLPVDFHGDGVFSQGKVEFITTDLSLTTIRDTSLVQQMGKDVLSPGIGAHYTLNTERFPQSSMRYSYLSSKRSTVLPLQVPSNDIGRDINKSTLALFQRTSENISLIKNGLKSMNRNRQLSSKRPRTLSVCIAGNDRVGNFVHSRTANRTECNSSFNESIFKSFPSDARISDELSHFLTSDVALDEVVEIRNRFWRGHVYNLSTTSESFVADGIITHNCNKIVKGEWGENAPRTLETVCKGKFFRSRGWMSHEDVVGKFMQNTPNVWVAQLECRRPMADGIYLPTWNRDRFTFKGWEPRPEYGLLWTGTDWGGTAASDVLWIQGPLHQSVEVRNNVGSVTVIPQGAYVIFKELVETTMGASRLADKVIRQEIQYKNQHPGWRIKARFADMAGKMQRNDWREHNPPLRTVWYISREVEPMIECIQALVTDELLYVDSVGCPNLCDDFESWRQAKGVEVHDDSTHGPAACLIAGTKIKTINGDCNIENIKIGDLVYTRDGIKKVMWAGQSKKDPQLVRKVTFSNGFELIGTDDHPVWVEGRGWVDLAALRYGDIICSWKNQRSVKKKYFIRASNSLDGLNQKILAFAIIIEDIFKKKVNKGKFTYIDSFGKTIMGKFLKGSMFTTSMRILIIISFQIMLVCYRLSICDTTSSVQNTRKLRDIEKLDQKIFLNQIIGRVRKEKLLGRKQQKLHGNLSQFSQRFVQYVKKNIKLKLINHIFAPIIVGLNGEGNQGVMMRHDDAQLAVKSSKLINIVRKNVVPAYVVKVSEPIGNRYVYDITVNECPEFYANGILVHNCKYALKNITTIITRYSRNNTVRAEPVVALRDDAENLPGALVGNGVGSSDGFSSERWRSSIGPLSGEKPQWQV